MASAVFLSETKFGDGRQFHRRASNLLILLYHTTIFKKFRPALQDRDLSGAPGGARSVKHPTPAQVMILAVGVFKPPRGALC